MPSLKNPGPPAYIQLQERIQRAIAKGELASGAAVPSVRRMAKELRVSQATVSHAYAELVREGVLRPERGRGMFVAPPPDREAMPVGLLCGFSKRGLAPGAGYHGRFFMGLQEEVLAQGCSLLVFGNSPRDRFRAADVQRVGSAIIFENFSPEEVIEFKSFGIPFLVADMDMSVAGVDSVITDNLGGMARVVRELHRRGRRRLVYVHAHRAERNSRWDPALDERLEGFRVAAETLGLEDCEVLRPPLPLHQAGQAAAREMLGRGALPEAVVTYGDQVGQGVLSVFEERGVRVPEDVAVTGFGDVERREGSARTLATVGFDAFALGRKSLQRLLKRLREPSLPAELVRIPGEWLPGESVPAAPGDKA